MATSGAPERAAGSAQGTPDAEAAGSAQGTPDAEVAEIWRRDCAVCHGVDALGTRRGPSLVAAGPALVDYVLRTGRMPIDDPDDEIERSEPAYDDETIGELVQYVTGLADGAVGAGPEIPEVDAGSGDVAEGGAVWRLNCAACHQWSGNGGAMLDRSAPDVRHATPTELGEAVRAGPFAMPSFGPSAVTDDELDSLATFLEEELKAPQDPGGWSIGHVGPVAEGAVALAGGLGALAVVARLLGTGRDGDEHAADEDGEGSG